MKEKAASILTGCLRFFQPTVLTLPLVFSLLGLGSASVTTILARYRHAFLVLTFVSLGFSFYLNYLKVHAHYYGLDHFPGERIHSSLQLLMEVMQTRNAFII